MSQLACAYGQPQINVEVHEICDGADDPGVNLAEFGEYEIVIRISA
jgi:hypothetical protein